MNINTYISASLKAVRSVCSVGAVAIILLGSVSAEAKSAPDSFAKLATKLLPSVVNISTTQVVKGRAAPQMPQIPPGSPFEDFFKEFFDRQRPENNARKATSLGSGFIIDDQGHVVTNNHVIQDADEITVVLHDDTRLDAKLIGRDARTDLAVLKIESSKALKGVEFGDSGQSQVGDWIVAIGNPFGLGGTVTAGIISARGRNIGAGPYDDFIQTDAAINRGNSGGPMFNLDGKVIGINTAIYSQTGGSVGIGFAIPSSAARPVIQQLIENGEVQRGWLGVHIQQVTGEIAESLGLKKPRGALVASILPNGPAEAAKIEPGDVILTFDGKTVDEMRNLPKIVADTKVGKTVQVVVWRSSRKKTLTVKVGVLEDKKVAALQTSNKSSSKRLQRLGLTVSSLTESTRKRFGIPKASKGIVVVEVNPDGPAMEKGISPGDLIVEVGQKEVNNPEDASLQIEAAVKKKRKSVLVYLEGKDGIRFVPIRLAEKK